MKQLIRLLMPVLICVAGLLPLTLPAANLTTEFDAANKLYEEARFADAATAYEKLIQTGHVSDTLYFNLGNAWYKSGQIGRAVVAYRRAEQLSPRDPAVRFNLQFVRKKVNGDGSGPDSLWQNWLNRLTVNQWTLLFMIPLWLWLLLLALTQWRPEPKAALRRFITLCGASTLLLALGLAARLQDYYLNHPAIVTAREAVVRKGPLDDSQSAFSVQDGMELSVLDRKDDWLEVGDTRGRTGWLKRSEVLLLKPNA